MKISQKVKKLNNYKSENQFVTIMPKNSNKNIFLKIPLAEEYLKRNLLFTPFSYLGYYNYSIKQAVVNQKKI